MKKIFEKIKIIISEFAPVSESDPIFFWYLQFAKGQIADREIWRVKKFCEANFYKQNCRAAAEWVKNIFFGLKFLEVSLSFFWPRTFRMNFAALKLNSKNINLAGSVKINIYESILVSLKKGLKLWKFFWTINYLFENTAIFAIQNGRNLLFLIIKLWHWKT